MSQDFKTMQSQAIRYAQEMHKKAQQCQANTSANESRQPCEFNITNTLKPSEKYIGHDNDFLLIFSLLLLISTDSGDRFLMLALLYILT